MMFVESITLMVIGLISLSSVARDMHLSTGMLNPDRLMATLPPVWSIIGMDRRRCSPSRALLLNVML